MIEITVAGILTDMDGTLVDSTASVEQTMTQWCHTQGIIPSEFLKHSHGVRTIDNLRKHQVFPKLGSEMSEAELEIAVFDLESQIAENGRIAAAAGGRGIEKLPGVELLLSQLASQGARYGIVTSATAAYATSALATTSIQAPFVITGNECSQGKPAPEPYLKGLAELAKMPGPPFIASNVLVLEDAPSGLTSGLAAGCLTLAVCTGQTVERIKSLESTYKVFDLTRVEVVSVIDGLITLRLKTLDEE